MEDIGKAMYTRKRGWLSVHAGLKEYSDWPTIPQLYVDKEFVGGCDILMSMHQNGELGKMFEDKGVLVQAEEVKEEKS